MGKLCGKGIRILILIFLAATALLCLRLILTDKSAARAATGDRREESPYEISGAQDMLRLAETVNEGKNDGFYGTYFKLTRDIDLSALYSADLNEWTPIGNSVYPFKGSFDGCGFTVVGLKTLGAKDVNGLFGYTGVNAVIKNLTVGGVVEGANYTAGIVGYNAGRVEGCSNRVAVSVINGAVRVGGVAGYNCGELISCKNEAGICANLSTIIGGVAGANSGTVKFCANYGAVCTQSSIVGGIVGFNFGSASITECVNAANASGKSTVGGIVGDNLASVDYACNYSDVTTVNGTAGGIAGNNAADGVILHTVSVSAVTGNYDIAALCGYNRGIFSNGFYNTDIFAGVGGNGDDLSRCKGLTTLQMTQPDTLENASAMYGLAADDGEIWIKRDYDEEFCYYPQLKYFHNENAEKSDRLSAVPRICADAASVSLSCAEFVYADCEYEPELYFGDYLLLDGYDYTAQYSDNKQAGQASVTVNFINGFSGSATKNFEILPREVFIEWTERQLYYNGELQYPRARVASGQVNGQEVTLSYKTQQAVCAGGYKVEAVLAETQTNGNYYLSESVLSYEILRKDLRISWDDTELIYNGVEQYPVVKETFGNIAGEVVCFEYAPDGAAAGVHSVTVKLCENAVNANYAFGPEVREYVISPRRLTLEWMSEGLVYDGGVKYPEAVISNGLVFGEKAEISYRGYESNIAANEDNGYTVTAYLTDNPVNANYYIANEACDYSICKSPLGIEWWDTPLYYNGAGQAPWFYVSSGRIGSDVPEFSVSDYSRNIAVSEGGKYTVCITLAESQANANYSFVPQERRYDILKAEFDTRTLKLSDKCFFYDGTAKSVYIDGELPFGITAEYSGNGETEIGEYTVEARLVFDSGCYTVTGGTAFKADLKIAQCSFADLPYGLNVMLTGTPAYGLNIEVCKKNRKFVSVKFDKSVSACYAVNFTGVYGSYAESSRFSVRLNSKQLKKKGLYVIYFDSEGQKVVPTFGICDGILTFEAEGLTGFAIVADKDFTPYIVIPIAASAAIAASFTACVIVKRRKRNAADVLPAVAEEPPTEENAEPADVKDGINVFTDGPFELDGVWCVSYETFLKSLKFKTKEKQTAICGGDEYSLKLYEAVSESAAYWQGKKYRIGSKGYYELLRRAKEKRDGKA